MRQRTSSVTCLVVVLISPAFAWAQGSTLRFEVEPGSTYTFLNSPMAPSAIEPEIEYDLQGLFSLHVDGDGTAEFTNVDLFIAPIGSLTTVGPQPLSSLLNYDLTSVPSIATAAVFRDVGLSINPGAALALSYDTPGTGGTLTGGRDARPVDGTGERYDATLRQVAVPEPTGLAVLNLALLLIASHRRR